jgi:predicted lipoprotein with Yx(FWY)xxD motif
MRQNRRYRESTHSVRFARMAGALVALGGISLSVIAASTDAGAASSVVVSTTKNAKMGTILVSGNTLYTLKPSKTACGTACLKIWPALVLPAGATKAKAGSGVSSSKLGTVKRSGGVVQVTYGGKPLYYFFLDTGPGQVKGNISDTWGKWSAVVTKKAAGSSSSSNSGSGNTAGSGGASF